MCLPRQHLSIMHIPTYVHTQFMRLREALEYAVTAAYILFLCLALRPKFLILYIGPAIPREPQTKECVFSNTNHC